MADAGSDGKMSVKEVKQVSSGLVPVKDSFAVTGTAKAQAGFTVYQIRFKVCVWAGGARWESGNKKC